MADSKLTALTETSVPALDDPIYSVDVSDTTDDAAGSSRKLTLQRLLGMLHGVCQGRLTTESGVPVSTSDRTAQSTIYFTPYNGNRIALYDGTRWVLYTFTERSLALSGLTSGKNYDVFLYDNAGTLTLELSAAWTNDTTRADALALQDGVYVKSGSTTRRYLGTIRTTGTTTTEDSVSKRFVWNAYNRTRKSLRIIETTNSWTYGTATWRPLNNSTANRVEVVAGLAESPVFLVSVAIADNGSTACDGATAFGLDSTTTPISSVPLGLHPNLSSAVPGVTAFQSTVPLGYHFYQWLETKGSGAGTMTFFGDAGLTYIQAGVTGAFEC